MTCLTYNIKYSIYIYIYIYLLYKRPYEIGIKYVFVKVYYIQFPSRIRDSPSRIRDCWFCSAYTIDQYWQILTKYWQKMTKTVKNMSFSKGACQKNKKKAPAASLKRSNNGLGLPIHIKKLPILINIRYYI